MKPFNLEEALAGKPVVTLTGIPARIICHDRDDPLYPLVALIKGNGAVVDSIVTYTKEGKEFGKGSKAVMTSLWPL